MRRIYFSEIVFFAALVAFVLLMMNWVASSGGRRGGAATEPCAYGPATAAGGGAGGQGGIGAAPAHAIDTGLGPDQGGAGAGASVDGAGAVLPGVTGAGAAAGGMGVAAAALGGGLGDMLPDGALEGYRRARAASRAALADGRAGTWAAIYDPGLGVLLSSGATLKPVGRHWVLGYDPWCAHCCGKWAETGVTASGATATPGWTVAMYPGVALGTLVYIDGLGLFSVEDRGVPKGYIDVAMASHAECYEVTGRREAFIVSWPAAEAAPPAKVFKGEVE